MQYFFTFTRSFFVIVLLTLTGCTTTEHKHSTIDDPAYLIPVIREYDIALYIDEIDGQSVNYGELDRISLDGGPHNLLVRLEYQPAAGSSVIVGGIGNLLLRAGTNKTFRTSIPVELQEGDVYGITAESHGDGLEIIVFTENAEVLRHSFKYRDGQFERVF